MDATGVEASRLAAAARERWLNKDEIVFLLLHYKACCGLIPLVTSVLQKPQSGTIFFCSSSMDYRKDGWNWQKKKGSETMVREDRAKLVVNRELVVLGAYAHSADSAIFHRRSYVLRADEPKIMLVHYLEDSKGKAKATPISVVEDEPMLMGDMDLFDLTVDSNMSDIYDPTHLPSFEVKEATMPPVIPIQTSITIKPLHITDFSPNWDFITGGAKLLICTSETLPSNTQFLVQFGRAVPVLAECISSTVLRCTAPRTMQPGYVSLTVVTFCNDTIVPMSEACNFQYKSTRAPFEEDDGTTETKSMSTFSEALSMKRSRDDDATSIYSDRSSSSSIPHQPFALDHHDLHERQYKIRVVERLSEFRRAITSKPLVQSTADIDEDTEEKRTSALLDDSAVAALSDKELGTLSDELIEDVVKQLVAVAGTSSELLEELNSLDDAGLSLLHYVCFYNCSQLVPLLLTHGAIVNQRSAQGQTALHLAAGCGHMSVVKVLVAHNADMTMFDFDCLTPADRAENCGHFDIADYLRSMAEPSPPKTSQNLSFSEMRSFGLFGDQDSSNEHNRKLLLGAFSNMSLHDKCALSLGTKQRRSNSTAECEEHESEHDMEVNSVMDDNDAGKLEAAMQLMGPDELALLEEEARVIQNNVRAWLLRRSYRHMRETTQKLQEVAKESLVKQQLEREERAAVTVQAATRSMLQRKSYLQQRNTAIKVQAAARGIICRKNFANMKKSALASLVIQKNVREWLAKPDEDDN